MSSYPFPGETITRTLRNIEFGCGRPRDEPAPPEIAALFREEESAFHEMGAARQCWLADRSQPMLTAYRAAAFHHGLMYNALLRVMRSHRDHCYTYDGCRFWLHTEPHGCRRNTIRIEAI